MNKITAQSLIDLLEEVAHAFIQTVRFGLRNLQRMSWPALLAAALVIAFILTILPLALVLFVVFLLLKLAVGAGVIAGRRRQRQRQDHYHEPK